MNPVFTELENYEARLRAAMLASDVTELDALIADDLAFVGPTGQVATKAEDLHLHATGQIRFHSIEFTDRQSRAFDGGVFTTVQTELAVTVDEQTIGGSFRYLRVWRTSPEGWQIVGGGVVPLPSPALSS